MLCQKVTNSPFFVIADCFCSNRSARIITVAVIDPIQIKIVQPAGTEEAAGGRGATRPSHRAVTQYVRYHELEIAPSSEFIDIETKGNVDSVSRVWRPILSPQIERDGVQ